MTYLINAQPASNQGDYWPTCETPFGWHFRDGPTHFTCLLGVSNEKLILADIVYLKNRHTKIKVYIGVPHKKEK